MSSQPPNWRSYGGIGHYDKSPSLNVNYLTADYFTLKIDYVSLTIIFLKAINFHLNKYKLNIKKYIFYFNSILTDRGAECPLIIYYTLHKYCLSEKQQKVLLLNVYSR